MRIPYAKKKQLRPGLLVSVRNEWEIEDAIAGGADWIDFKEPHEGPLGAVPCDQASRMVQAVGGRCPISAALGELVEWQDSPAQGLLQVPEIKVVKIGLSGCAALKNWSMLWEAVFRLATEQGRTLCAVVYSDWQIACAPQPADVLALAIQSGARYLLIDTWNKTSASTLECFPAGELGRFVELANQAGLQTILAGKLKLADVSSATELGTDLLAVRGAACQGLRTDKIHRASVRSIKDVITMAITPQQCCSRDRIREFN